MIVGEYIVKAILGKMRSVSWELDETHQFCLQFEQSFRSQPPEQTIFSEFKTQWEEEKAGKKKTKQTNKIKTHQQCYRHTNNTMFDNNCKLN